MELNYVFGIPATDSTQGLADEEGIDVDDEGEEDDELGDGEDEEPIFSNSNGGNGKQNGQAGATTTYSYKDVFGKEYEKRRQQWIAMKVCCATHSLGPCSPSAEA